MLTPSDATGWSSDANAMDEEFFGNGRGMLTPSDAIGPSPDAKPQPTRSSIPEMPSLSGAAARRGDGVNPVTADLQPARRKSADGASKTGAGNQARERSKFNAPNDDGVMKGKGFRLPDVVMTVAFARKAWFAVSFIAPVILGALYLLLLAPDQYVTEYRFSVRVPVGQPGSMASAGASLSAVFGGNPTPGTDLLDNYTLADYATSAQAARDTDARVNLRDAFNKPLDPFSKIGSKPSAERLAKYWQSMVYSNYDVASGLAVVRVKAYSAEDSYAIATNLFSLSSDLVNSIGANSQQDSVRYAQLQFDRANAEVATLRGELVNLRRSSDAVDPVDRSVVAGNVNLVNGLVSRRSQLQAQAEAIAQQLKNANAMQVVVQKQQIAALDKQIAEARQDTGNLGGRPKIVTTVGRFEEVEAKLKNALAVQSAASSALSNMRSSAEAQRLYLTAYVKPSLPESPLGPSRWLNVMLLMMIAAMVWVIGKLIGNSIMEHA